MSLKRIDKEKYIKEKILIWYRKNGRSLPWRKKGKRKLPNSYFILISEFMLQQTTVNSVVPKFHEFIRNWPTLEELSKIKESTILKFWSGLGYYNRARNLLKSIKLIARKYDYKIPKEYNDLIVLPGIGDYTAKAILGIAYNKAVMPIDSNIDRIIKRVYGLKHHNAEIKSNIELFGTKLISSKNSSNFIQALMDYGSIICRPKIPVCNECIIQSQCTAFKKKLTNIIPIKTNKNYLKLKKFTRAYLIINEFNEILTRKRLEKGMLQSMFEVPNDIWVTQRKDLKKDELIKSYPIKFNKIKEKIIYSFSHFDLIIEIFFTKVQKSKAHNCRWLSLKKIDNSGLPTVMKKIVKKYINSN